MVTGKFTNYTLEEKSIDLKADNCESFSKTLKVQPCNMHKQNNSDCVFECVCAPKGISLYPKDK